MEYINRDKEGRFTKKRKVGVLVILAIIGIMLLGLGYGLVSLLEWHDDHVIVYNKVLTVKTAYPITIKDREKIVIRPLIMDIKVDTPLEQMICETFGNWECKTALAVAQAESGMRVDAWNSNTNGTLDIGLFQINSIHWDKEGCSLAELVTEEGNVKCAKKIYDDSGWSAWSVVNNGEVGRHL